MNDCLRGFTCELTGRHTCPLSNRNGMVAAVHVGVHGGRAHESAASLQWNLLSVHDFGNLEQCILPAGYPMPAGTAPQQPAQHTSTFVRCRTEFAGQKQEGFLNCGPSLPIKMVHPHPR